ncbi:MAG: PHP domain-containing protein [Clostridia bacterium]
MARFYYDFHIHSCLSPCGDNDMTPNNIVNMALLNHLDVIAVSDHNAMLNLPAIMSVAKENGLVVIPAMELQTAEDIHVLCLFSDLENAMKFSDLIYDSIPKIKNKVNIYGEQQVLDESDNIKRLEENLLIVSSSYGVYEIPKLVKEYNGVAVLAHIDKASNGAIAILGSINPDMNYETVEISKNCKPSFFEENSYIKRDYNIIYDSDAHYLWDIAEQKNYLDLETLTIENVLKYISSKKKGD